MVAGRSKPATSNTPTRACTASSSGAPRIVSSCATTRRTSAGATCVSEAAAPHKRSASASARAGSKVSSITAPRVRRARPAPATCQQHGHAHGGVVAYLADNAIAFAGGSLLGDVLTAELKLNHLRPARGGTLVARAEAVGPGSRLVVCRCDVFALAGGAETLCATALGTVIRPG